MRATLLFANYLLLLLLVTGCASSGKIPLPAVIAATGETQRYNMQLDFRKHHFSGMLMVRQTIPGEIRILSSTYFGLSLFDFTLRGEECIVNNCIEAMNSPRVIKLLEADFKTLFLPGQGTIKKKSTTFESRKSGSGFGKKIIESGNYSDTLPQKVVIRHPWIKLKIQLDVLDN